MSILLDPPPLTRRTTPARATGWFTLYVLLAIGGGALLGAVLIRAGMERDAGVWSRLIADHGPDRVLRRIQTLLAVLLAPLMLKKIGWPGLRDLGWSSRQTRGERKRDFVIWFGLGVAVMAGIFALSIATGVRVADPKPFFPAVWALFYAFCITGIGVGFIEETLTRGVLYRSLARAWTPWLAAGISSLLFAWAHFMKAEPESFYQGPLAVLGSSLFADFSHEAVPLKFLNMLAFGLLLCRLVKHRGDIWAAVGLHAAAVGMIKFFSKMTEFDRAVAYRPWIGGHSAKFDDGWLLTLCLFALLLGLEWTHRARLTSYGNIRL